MCKRVYSTGPVMSWDNIYIHRQNMPAAVKSLREVADHNYPNSEPYVHSCRRGMSTIGAPLGHLRRSESHIAKARNVGGNGRVVPIGVSTVYKPPAALRGPLSTHTSWLSQH
jgi:hypothetical protein